MKNVNFECITYTICNAIYYSGLRHKNLSSSRRRRRRRLYIYEIIYIFVVCVYVLTGNYLCDRVLRVVCFSLSVGKVERDIDLNKNIRVARVLFIFSSLGTAARRYVYRERETKYMSTGKQFHYLYMLYKHTGWLELHRLSTNTMGIIFNVISS